MEQSNGNPNPRPYFNDKDLIKFFKERNGVATNAERLIRIIPNYNRIFNRNIPKTNEGSIELRGLLTVDYLESLKPKPVVVIPPAIASKPKKSESQKEKSKQRGLLNKQRELEAKQRLEELERLQLQRLRDDLGNSFRPIIKSPIDVVVNFTFEEINALYQYSIRDFIDLFLDYNPHIETLQDRIVILSVYAPNETTPTHIFLLTRTGASNLYEFLRGNNQYSKDSSEKMETLFNSFNEGYTFRFENRQIIKRIQKIAKEGEYFNYLHKTNIDLTNCGIFNKKQHDTIMDEGLETYNYDLLVNKGCLYYTLLKHIELTENTYYDVEDLNIVFTDIQRTSLKLETVKQVAIQLKICIHLRYNDGVKNRTLKINDEDVEMQIVKIGYLADHYFLDYKIQNTMYSVVNYFNLLNEKDYEFIYRKQTKGGYARDNTGNKFITTYDIVEVFLNNIPEYLEDLPNIIEKSNQDADKQTKAVLITEIELTKAIDKIEDDQLYNYELDLQQRQERLNKRLEKDNNLDTEWIQVSCDLETNTNSKSYKIQAITSHYKLPNEPAKAFIGNDCIVKMLNALPNNCILYFHNTKFDISHFQGYFTNILEYVENEGRFIYQKAIFYKKTFYIIDTMNYLSGSLKSLAEDFKLKCGKELINYQIYNQITNGDLDIGKWYRNVEDDFGEYYNNPLFLENIDKWNLRRINNKNEYNALGYLVEYGKIDVDILQQLYNIITKSIFDNFGIDIKFGKTNGFKLYPTISSISREFTKKTGCLDEVCSNKGVIREFIDGALVGGRTMLMNNQKVICNTVSQSIIDYTSLYPSAMYRMGKYPKGKPKLIKNIDDIGDNYYVVKIRIGSGIVNNKINYPIISKITKRRMVDIDGKIKNLNTRCFTNDFKIGEEIVVDKYTLEDAIEFQGLDYSIVYGLGWLDGYNYKIKDIVKLCFDERLKLKKEGNNAGQTAYKLILNSLYGFTAEKPHLTKINIVNEMDVMHYVLGHSKRACSASKIIGGNKYVVKSSEDINKHFNYNHIATSILSYSKRLMNEVFDVAEDNNIDIQYTDTDSLFLNTDDLNLLESKYIEKYERPLMDNKGALNTFKIDMDGFVIRFGGEYIKTNCKEQGISSEDLIGGEGIYLGKKTYLVEVKNKNDVNFTGYIFSSKGITDTSLFHYCNNRQMELGVNYGLKELFVGLSNNEYVEIDLCEEGNKYRVEYRNTATFQRRNFTRRIGGFKEIEFN